MAGLVDYLASLSRNPVVAVGIPVGFGLGMGSVTRRGLGWYENVRKPAGEPPRLAFPIAWTALYVAMGYASHLLVRALDRSPSAAVRSHASTALKLYYSQLVLNFAWTCVDVCFGGQLKPVSPLFFGLNRTALALVDILGMVGTVSVLIQQTSQVDTLATGLFAPYLGWLSYATYLNAGILWLNQDVCLSLIAPNADLAQSSRSQPPRPRSL